MLQVLKLFIEARDQEVREVHFPGSVGSSVTVTPAQIESAVSQFLGIESSSGPRGQTAAPEQPTGPPEAPPALPGSKKQTGSVPATAQKKQKKKKKPDASELGLEGGNFGKKLAFRVRRRDPAFPVYYPTTVVAGSEYDQVPRAYRFQDHSLERDETFSYRFTLETPSGDYYGLQGTAGRTPRSSTSPTRPSRSAMAAASSSSTTTTTACGWSPGKRTATPTGSRTRSCSRLTAEQMIAIARDAKKLEPAPNA